MPQYDIYHETVKRALQKDGWMITHDPYTLRYGRKRLYADLGAEQLISAEKGTKKIVVEIKSFVGPSDVQELEQAIGQYFLYRQVLDTFELERLLYLAVSTKIFISVFKEGLGSLFLEDHMLRLVVFDQQKEVITQWIPE